MKAHGVKRVRHENSKQAARRYWLAGIDLTYDMGGYCEVCELIDGKWITRQALTKAQAKKWKTDDGRRFSLRQHTPAWDKAAT